MRKCPQSRFEDENGVVSMGTLLATEPEYPEVVAWETEYAGECDRLSANKARRSGKQFWGRWILNLDKPKGLECVQVMPSIGKMPQRELDTYWIELSRIDCNGGKDGSSYTWQQHLNGKNWIGDKGIADFIRAVKEIAEKHPEWLHK